MLRLPAFLPVFLGISLLVSCAQSDPTVLSVTATAVFDYVDADSAPVVRLALFIQTDSEAQRARSITAVHTETDMRWTISSPRMISGSEKNWAGYTNLQPAPGEHIPTGAYTCRYEDAAGNESDSRMTVDYPESLLTSVADTARDCIQTSVIEYVALYSESGELMFFNKRRNTWRTNNDIAKDYRNAYTLRRCLVTGNNGIVCLMPPESLKEPSGMNAEEQTSGDFS